MGRIQEGLSPSLGHDRHRGNSCGSAPGYNFGLAAINLLTSFLPSPKAALGVLAIIRGIGAWSGNTFLQTKQSLASSDFKLVFKKHSNANQGKHGIAF